MTRAAKLRVMEELWDDLCRDSEGVAPPDWHKGVLEERREKVDRGDGEFRPWAEVKQRLIDNE